MFSLKVIISISSIVIIKKKIQNYIFNFKISYLEKINLVLSFFTN